MTNPLVRGCGAMWLGALALAQAGCASGDTTTLRGAETEPISSEMGSISLALTLPTGVSVDVATVQIEGPDGYSSTHEVSAGEEPRLLSVYLTSLPVGDYRITLIAADCAGSADVRIEANQTQYASIELTCGSPDAGAPAATGSVIIDAFVNRSGAEGSCEPLIEQVLVAPLRPRVQGEPSRIELFLTDAADPNSVEWIAPPSGGTLGVPRGGGSPVQFASFSCDAPGTVTTTVRVTSPGGACVQQAEALVLCLDEPTEPGDIPPPLVGCDDQLITFDDLYTQIQSDILRLDADDRVFTRYLLLTNRFNAGVCARDLDQDRWALSKVLNMLSIETSVEPPFAIDSRETIYRIDLRDYAWDRAIEVDGQSFVDGWEAVAAENPYAVRFEGDEADTVSDQAGTPFPWMYADSFLATATAGNLYYALIDVDPTQTLERFALDDLGIDIATNFAENELIRAGTSRSIVSRTDALIERHETEVRKGSLWLEYSVEDLLDSATDLPAAPRQGLFTLPNGLFGFLLADADGNLVTESDALFDPLQDDFQGRLPCFSCHKHGLVAVLDEVRPEATSNPFDFNAEDFEKIFDTYPPQEQLDRILEADSEPFLLALQRAAVPAVEADPITGVSLRFGRDVALSDAAGDLGLDSNTFRQNLNIFDPNLQVLAAATLDRNDFTQLFLASLCVAQTFSQNQPNLDDCEAAIEALR